jgi:hypothetical protein
MPRNFIGCMLQQIYRMMTSSRMRWIGNVVRGRMQSFGGKARMKNTKE